ncbi:hypothetical protein [Nonomuraea sp. NPDC049758]|uniref:hypothetical protein n=1 Tax=Nonomuraea sp. NPDC049758 TaxID=3154360 RepID=UPI0034360C38
MTEEAVPPVAAPAAPARTGGLLEKPLLVDMFALAKKLDGTWPLFARSLDPADDPALLRGRYRAVAASTARWSVRRKHVEDNLSAYVLLPMLGVAVVVLVWVFSVTSVQKIFLAVVGLTVFIWISVWIENRRHRPFFRYLLDPLVSVLGVGCFPAVLYLRHATGPAWAVDLAGRGWLPIPQSIGTACCALVLGIIPVKVVMWQWDRESRASPTEPLFEQLAAILARAEPDRRGQLAPGARREILTLLGRVAFLLRVGIPTVARGGTPLTRAVVRARAVEAAKAVIDLQLWVALPSTTAYDDLRTRVAELTRTVITGEYDRLPTRDTTPEETRRTWHARVLETVRTLVIALLPVAGLVTAGRLGLRLPAPFDDGAMIAVVAWAVVLLLGFLDPNFASHLAAARDLTTLPTFNRSTDKGA